MHAGVAGPKRLGLFLGVQPTAGGMFQYAQSIAEGLAALPADRFLGVAAYGDRRWEPILARLGVRGYLLTKARSGQRLADAMAVLRVPGTWSRALARIVNPVVRELRDLKCDAWIFPAQENLTYQVAGPVVGTIHDLMHRYENHFDEVSKKGRYGIREHRFRNLATRSRLILVDSEVGRKQVVESYGVDPAKIRPLPYVAPSYLTDLQERADFNAHYALPVKFLLYPAQFWQHKNHLRLLEALRLASSTCPDMKLVLCGNKAMEYDRVVARALELGLQERVFYVGYVPDHDLGGFYRRARGLVMPTFFGPTNIPPLEAFVMGCPVAVSGIYGMPEQCGDAALYFDPHSVQDIAQQMIRLWNDDALVARLRVQGRERAAKSDQNHFNARLLRALSDAFLTGTPVPPAIPAQPMEIPT